MNRLVCRTIEVAIGGSYTTNTGVRSIDFLYYGTVDAVTLTGSDIGSQAIPLPPNVPYTLEYNENGYAPIIVSNLGGDASVFIVEKK